MLSGLSSHWHYLWLVTASLIAGVMNALAGGGSFLSFPAMLSMGVLPIQANATNTVALWPGQLTSLATLKSDVRKDLLPVICLTSVLGGLTGAIVLLRTGQETFERLIPWLLLTGTIIFGLSGPISRWMRVRSAESHRERTPKSPLLFCALFPVCFYIGYFGAGGGSCDDHPRAVRRRKHARSERHEDRGGISLEPGRHHYLCCEWGRSVALLPHLYDLCCRWRLCGSAICAAYESQDAAAVRRHDGMRDLSLFFLEATVDEAKHN